MSGMACKSRDAAYSRTLVSGTPPKSSDTFREKLNVVRKEIEVQLKSAFTNVESYESKGWTTFSNADEAYGYDGQSEYKSDEGGQANGLQGKTYASYVFA